MTATAIHRRVEHRGAVYRLRRELEAVTNATGPLEFVVEGPRGTGKSNGVGYLLWKLCRKYKNVRVLVIRTARSLLTDTFCKTYEEDVCPGHLSISQIARTQRHEYYFPSTRSRIVLGGLDQPQRYYGSDWDIIVPEEAVAFDWKEIEPFLGSLRNGKLPFHALIYPTNPDAPENWVNKRCSDEGGPAKRMRCFHKDNPALWDWDAKAWTPRGVQFMETLSRYTGVQRDRHVLGLWRGREGMVWETYDPLVHIIQRPARLEDLGISWYFASIDWGFSSPGCLQVWGVDGDKRIYRVAEWYASGQLLDWWTEKAVEAAREFKPMRVIVADSADRNAIETMNVRLGALAPDTRPGVVPCDKTNRDPTSKQGALAGLDLVRERFVVDRSGKAHIYFLRDSARWRDESLVDAGQPYMTEQEIPSYCYLLDDSGRPMGERVDDCVDHGCDAMRYAATWVWRKDLSPLQAPREDKAGTMGAVFGHARKMARYERRPAFADAVKGL